MKFDDRARMLELVDEAFSLLKVHIQVTLSMIDENPRVLETLYVFRNGKIDDICILKSISLKTDFGPSRKYSDCPECAGSFVECSIDAVASHRKPDEEYTLFIDREIVLHGLDGLRNVRLGIVPPEEVRGSSAARA